MAGGPACELRRWARFLQKRPGNFLFIFFFSWKRSFKSLSPGVAGLPPGLSPAEHLVPAERLRAHACPGLRGSHEGRSLLPALPPPSLHGCRGAVKAPCLGTASPGVSQSLSLPPVLPAHPPAQL